MKGPENGYLEETSVWKRRAYQQEIRENQNPIAPSVRLCLVIRLAVSPIRPSGRDVLDTRAHAGLGSHRRASIVRCRERWDRRVPPRVLANAGSGAYRKPMQSNFDALAASPLRTKKAEKRAEWRLALVFVCSRGRHCWPRCWTH